MEFQDIPLFPGVSWTPLQGRKLPPSDPGGTVLELYHCRRGQLRWAAGSGEALLGPGDLAVRVWGPEEQPVAPLGSGCEGLRLRVRRETLLECPPEALADLDRQTLEALPEAGTFAVFPGTHATDDLFDGFYGQPEPFRLAMARVKALELLLYLLRIPWAQQGLLTMGQAELVAIVRAIHTQLTRDYARRYTIEELSRQYAVNPTTLKSAFKSVYGSSLAAHIKEHRMEEAARLLRTTDRSIAQIALDVGYESQSKFSAAFKSHFQLLPSAYRKRRGDTPEPREN